MTAFMILALHFFGFNHGGAVFEVDDDTIYLWKEGVYIACCTSGDAETQQIQSALGVVRNEEAADGSDR